MDEDLLTEIVLGPGKGKRRAYITYDVVRELNEGDVEFLLNPPPMGTKAPQVQKIRSSHHTIARLIAEGRSQREVAMIVGYSESRISVLNDSPAFAELVEYYKTQKDQVFLDVHERLASLGIETIEELRERLELEPEKFSNATLMELAQLTLDRSIAPPKNRPGNGAGVPAAAGGAEITIKFIPAQAEAPALPDAKTIDMLPLPEGTTPGGHLP